MANGCPEYVNIDIEDVSFEFHISRYTALVNNGAIEFDEDRGVPYFDKNHKYTFEDIVNIVQCGEPIT